MATLALSIDAEPYRITVEKFDALVQMGFIEDPGSVELIDGVLVEKMPQKFRHSFACRALFRLFQGYERGNANQPVLMDDRTVVETDFVVMTEVGISKAENPAGSDLDLAIEVSDRTLSYDLGVKKKIYAEAGVPEYWVVDIPHQRLIVFQSPSGDDYLQKTEVGPEGEATIPHVGVTFSVRELFTTEP